MLVSEKYHAVQRIVEDYGIEIVIFLDKEKYDQMEAEEIMDRFTTVHDRWWKAREFIYANIDKYEKFC